THCRSVLRIHLNRFHNMKMATCQQERRTGWQDEEVVIVPSVVTSSDCCGIIPKWPRQLLAAHDDELIRVTLFACEFALSTFATMLALYLDLHVGFSAPGLMV